MSNNGSNGRATWEDDLSMLEQRLPPPRVQGHFPNHVHATTQPARQPQRGPVRMPPAHRAVNEPPAPPPVFGGPLYPPHLGVGEQADPRAILEGSAGPGAPLLSRGAHGGALGIDGLDLRPSFPTNADLAVAPIAPLATALGGQAPVALAGPPPAATGDRPAVRPLSAVAAMPAPAPAPAADPVQDHVVLAKALPLAEILRQAAFHAGALQGLLGAAAMLLDRMAPAPAEPEPPAPEVQMEIPPDA